MLSSSCRLATVWCLLLPLRLTAQEAAAPEKCVFAGTVHDSVTGQPLAKATVHVMTRKTGQASYTAITDAAGAFRFEAIDAGDYTIQVNRPGYGDALAVSLKPGQATSWLHFRAGQSLTGAVAALDPQAVVSGRVMDAAGEPIAGAQVEALGRQWQGGVAKTQTTQGAEADERGQYRFSLDPGRYLVSAGPRAGSAPSVFSEGPGKPEMIVASLVYPNVAGVEGATEFELHPGQQLGGIDFKLPTVVSYHVRGSLRPSAQWRPGNSLWLQRRDSDRFGAHGAMVKNGSFDIPGVPPGSYWLRVFSPMWDHLSGKMAVEVSDRDVNGVVFDVISSSTLKGRVRFDDSEPRDPSQVQFFLNQLDWIFINYGSSAAPKPDGSFQFDNVPAGEFVLHMAEHDGLYVESVSYNHREAPGGKLDLSGGAAGEVEVVLASGTGQVSGSIHWPDAAPGTPPTAPAGNIAAVVVPVDGVTGNSGVRVMGIDQEGRFQFRALAPGRYFVWAVTHFDDRWQNMEFVTQMQSRGVAVDLPKNGSAQVEIAGVIE